jgi:hypothetical protein
MRQLMSFDFRRSRYERPNQTWICGRAADGCACALGPDRRGRCRAEAECRPRREQERWVCCRAKDQGGPCSAGPRPDGRCSRPIPPCTPVRSLRARRGRAARWAATLTLGLLVILFAGSSVDRQAWLSPGPLSAAHQSVQDCAACHEQAEAGALGWLHAAFAGSPAPGDGDSRQCLTCHEPGAAPLQAHGAASADLAALTEAARAASPQTPGVQGGGVRAASLTLAERLFGSPIEPAPGNGGELACATCHAEHAGTDHDSTALGNQPCQACHVTKFASFTNGHPAFEAYPYDRRTRINFDHDSHIRRHFPESDPALAPKACASCHEPDGRGAQMLAGSFEQTCAACHAGEVRGESAAGTTGVAVFAVPGLDLESLRQREAGIGAWPELSDRPLTPFQKAILSGDPALEEALATFQQLDPLDLRDASDAEIRAVAEIAWSIKEITYDLIDRGPPILQARLARGLDAEVDAERVRALTGGLPLAAVRDAAQAWFPELATEVARHRAGQPVPIPPSAFGAPSSPDSDSADDGSGDTGSILGDTDGGDSGDILAGDDSADDGDILSGDQGADTGNILAGDNGAESGDILSGADTSDDGDILSGDDTADSSDILGGDESADDGDILAGDDTADSGDILSGDESADSGDILFGEDSAADGGDILGGDDNGGGDILSGDDDSGGGLFADDEGGDGADQETAEITADWPEPNPEDWSALGGWYRDYYALSYRPGDHADPFLTQWITVAAEAGAAEAGAVEAGAAKAQAAGTGSAAPAGPAGAILARLTAKGAPGQCAKCHSLDAQPDGSLTANWQSFRPQPHLQGFIRFRHAPHFAQLTDDSGCVTCHTLQEGADYQASFADYDAGSFAANFRDIDKATCSECHIETAAGDACTQCHNYHVGQVEPRPLATAMDKMTAAPAGE